MIVLAVFSNAVAIYSDAYALIKKNSVASEKWKDGKCSIEVKPNRTAEQRLPFVGKACRWVDFMEWESRLETGEVQ